MKIAIAGTGYSLKRFNQILGSAVYVIFLICMIVALSNKCNYHIDEVLNYALSNQKGSFVMMVENGRVYTSGQKVFMDYFTVQPESRFDYENVWSNQSKDVHPPFYYALLHTICSFFPQSFSLWYAGSLNFIFALLTLLVLRKLSCYFLKNVFLINMLSLAFVLSAGILSSITFLRMYVAAMFWVTLLTYCFVREVNETETRNRFLLKVTLVTTFCALTHYYCVLYAVLISVVYGVYLLFGRQYKATRDFCFAMSVAGIISYLIFPPMIQHIFFSYRGKEALNNAGNISDFLERIKRMFSIANEQLFGNIGLFLILAITALVAVYIVKNNKTQVFYTPYNKRKIISYLFILLPVFLYLVTISKIAAYLTDRYMFPVYALFFWGINLLFIDLVSFIFEPRQVIAIIFVVLFGLTVGSYMHARWPYLYLHTQAFIELAKSNADAECICLYDARWKLALTFREISNYKRVVFFDIKNINSAGTTRLIKNIGNNKEKLVLCLIGIPSNEHKKYIKLLRGNSKQQDDCRKLGSFDYGTSYVITNNY